MGNDTNEPEITEVQNLSQEDMVGTPGTESDTDSVIDLEAVTGEGDAQANEIASMILAMQEENAQSKDRLLRATAEMENLRKRTQREIVDARAYAITDFARDMLGATDNLVRALAAFPTEERANADPATKSLIEGIEMTEREMQRLMQKNGIKPIQAEGEKFNPHKHQAMFEVPDTSVPAGTVVQVVQAGFEIGNRVLRPVMVGVSKGGPKGGNAPKADLHSVKIEPRTEGFEIEEPDEFETGEGFNGHIDREV